MIDVVMPQMGESITEGTLTRWLKKPGDKVERDEPLFEISTDKVDTEIPAPAAGVLSEVLVQEGTTVAINSIVARIGDSASQAASATPAAPKEEDKPAASAPPGTDVGPSAAASGNRAYGQQQAPPPTPAPAAAGPYPIEPQPSAQQTASQPAQQTAPPPPPSVAQPDGTEEQGPLSPLVRKMAREYNIDLGQVRGTGAGGRITKQDVEAYMSSQGARSLAAASPQPSAPAAAQPPASPQLSAGRIRQDPDRTDEHHAAEDRRAHGDEQTYLRSRDYRAPR